MGFKKMKTITTLLFLFGIFVVMIRAKPPRRMDLYNPNLFEKLSHPKNIEISQDYHPEIVERLTPKKAESLYDPEIVQRLIPKNAETKRANPAYAQTVATLQIP